MSKEKVTIFLGNFGSEEELQNYVKFIYDEDGNASSELGRQTGIEYFDEDFTEAFLFNKEQPFEQILLASYADTFEPSLEEKLSLPLLSNYNSIILLYGCNHNNPITGAAKVSWAGVFSYSGD